MQFFTSEPVTGHITRIKTPCGVCMYFVQGETGAALLDTGFGIGDLKSYVDAIARTPYKVLLSHGHLDHAGGAGQFDEAYLSTLDWELERWHCTRERRIDDVIHGPGGMPAGMSEEDFLPSRKAPYLPLADGEAFALGGVTVQSIALPGHTRGTMIFLIPEDRVAIFGDACGENTLLLFKESAPIEEYRENLLRVQTLESTFDRVLRNHGSCESEKRILADSIELCGQILARQDAAIPSGFAGMSGLLARPHDHPGKAGNILYNPENLFAGNRPAL